MSREYDPYALLPEHVRKPPTDRWSTIRQLGPGLLLTGSIVGSGELIATTRLGAEVGFVVLWLILLSCAVKVPVQSELGRHAIATGQTTFVAFNKVPGPRLRVSWLVWGSLFLLLWSTMQVGGIFGTMSLSLDLIFPVFGNTSWLIILTLVGMGLGLVGQYMTLERITTILVALFTFTTLASALLLFWTPYAVSPGVILDGLRFALPPDGAVTAFAVFGITGVGASELLLYPYWCVEKGYARSAGPRDGSPDWRARALGWIGVMKKDVWLCMVIYTLATLAFFFLGAAVLHAQGMVPEGFGTVQILSGMYTETLGNWAFYLFGVGAFVVLFSTYFVTIVGQSRMLADALSVLGLVTYARPNDRQRVVRIIGVLLPLVYLVLYVLWSAPVTMVIIGALMQTILLPAIGWAALYFSRTTAREAGVPPSRLLMVALTAATLIMAAFAIYAVWVRF
ncbi:MAG: divalent metal cation transporter [Gemmatimonadetes bacterium]|nr:divalent metal cation transporter [Gemmatimonadota bacterium]MYA77476.1 divalent metal cation transporter [Gemmatimonadota bacterium]MYG17183.1 divalent metal cation transporter [Gemmatimonadota bacterium]MYH17817.1 divalent metal cation transporter [Gemmatimonadota bacterium]